MKKLYTIGIYFQPSLESVALLLKNRPAWQAGRYNFPGGHIEEGESAEDCVIREFIEECGITTTKDEWKYIGTIDNETDYQVEVFTAIHNPSHGVLSNAEDQEASWVSTKNLPSNIISNLAWLIPFAMNTWRQGNNDQLIFGHFKYKNF